MAVELDALAVVNQLRDLAADPMNRRAIVQDQGCLPGLILFLDHTNPQVVYSALLVSCSLIQVFFWLGGFHPVSDCRLKAIGYLGECRVNQEKLKGELGMMLSLQNIIQK